MPVFLAFRLTRKIYIFNWFQVADDAISFSQLEHPFDDTKTAQHRRGRISGSKIVHELLNFRMSDATYRPMREPIANVIGPSTFDWFEVRWFPQACVCRYPLLVDLSEPSTPLGWINVCAVS